MVDSILSSGLSAYRNTQSLSGRLTGAGGANGIGGIGSIGGDAPVSGSGNGGFGDMLSNMLSESVGSLQKGEAATISAARGTADITDVVGAVQGAMRTLETVTAIRDKVISAYQDILRMPI